jgi:predicted permease
VREIAVRLALGASRARIARPLFFEQVFIAAAGGLAGGTLAWWTLRMLPHVAPADLPRLRDVSFNLASLGFATLAAFLTATIVGLWPAWQVPDAQLRDLAAPNRVSSSRGTRSADTMRTALVFAQVALAVVLLVGAALIGRSLLALFRVNPGYQPDHVLTFQVSTPSESSRERGRLTALYTTLLDRLRASSNVVAAGVASTLPLHSGLSRGTFGIEGRPPAPDPSDRPNARWQIVTADFLTAMGTRVVRGRGFVDTDNATAEQVVLVNETLANRYFPGEDAIGRRLIGIGRSPRRIVGIVETMRLGPLSRAGESIVYYATPQVGEILAYSRISGGVAVRVKGDPEAMIATIRTYVREIDGGAPMFNAVPLRDRLARTFAQPRFYAVVLTLFAALALTTAVLGIYGVLAYAVERRRVEFGVRRALGADERHVIALVLRRAMTIAVAGIGVGLIAAASGAGLLQSMLFGVRPLDPATFAAVAIGVLGVAAAAAWLPARRAVRVEPSIALRSE